jgi:hypothetical protein
MKYKLLVILSLNFLLPFLAPSSIEAHPGRTDANGGHTCRTNCESWGLEYGEYHYHGGGGTSGRSSGETYAAPVQEVVTLPTNTPIPLRIPTKTPTPTLTPAPSPTATPTPTIEPTKKPALIMASATPFCFCTT